MKKVLFLFTALLIGYSTYAQFDEDDDDFKTIFSDGQITRINGFGGPFMSFTSIDGQFAHVMGGGGGVILNNQLIIGGYGMGTTNWIDAEKNLGNGNSLYDNLGVRYGHGGLWFGYIFNGNSPIHPVIHTQLGWGTVQLTERVTNVTVLEESSFIVNPVVEIEMNITRFFRLSVGANYNLTFGVDNLDEFSNTDFSGPGGFLSFKFGWF